MIKLNKSLKISLLVLIITGLFLSSCKVAFVNNGKSENIRPNKLYKHLVDNEFEYDYLTLKFSAEINSGETSETFSGMIRIKRDSIIWISLRAYNIEGARMCITQDSVKFLNRMNSTYYLGDFKFITDRFAVDLDYNSIQSILTNTFFIYPEPDDTTKAIGNYKPCEDSMFYCMSSISQRKYTRYYVDDRKQNKWERKLEKETEASEDQNRYESNEFVFQIVKVFPEIYRVKDIFIENYIQQQSLYVRYDKQYRVGSQYFPNEIYLELLSPKFESNLTISIESVSIENESMSFPFKISEKYEEIIIE